MTVRLIHGDCRDVLRSLPDESVHCVVTSPPYWGLRDYGVDGQIGLEASVNDWLAEMVAVFREVRRVLRDDGTLWLNLGDSYAGSRCGGQSGSTGLRNPGQKIDKSADAKALLRTRPTTDSRRRDRVEIPRSDLKLPGVKPKDLIGQPWRVAFALQADGWWLRQDIIWHKPNPMPESVTDRCTKAHEYVFLLSKRKRYYYDFSAMQEPVNGGAHPRRAGNKRHKLVDEYLATGDERHRTTAGLVAYAERQDRRYKTPDGWDTSTGEGCHGSIHKHGREKGAIPEGVGRRQGPPGNVAERAPKETGNALDSAYADGKSVRMGRGAGWRERKLAEASSGTKNNGSFDEAMAFMPVTRNKRSVWTVASEPFKEAHFATFPPELIEPCIKAGSPVGGVVLDPFGGAGTTGLVADRLQRNAVLVELNREYVEIAERRIRGDAPLLAEVEQATRHEHSDGGTGSLNAVTHLEPPSVDAARREAER
jgi:DNA modification methylase